VRLARAKLLLAQTEVPVPNVATAAGFGSREYLAAVFKDRPKNNFRLPMSGHPERSKGSRLQSKKILRCAQDDNLETRKLFFGRSQVGSRPQSAPIPQPGPGPRLKTGDAPRRHGEHGGRKGRQNVK